MATYDELRNIISTASGDPLKNRIFVAVMIKAQALVDGTPTANQLAWATEALADPLSKLEQVLHYMIANNSGAAVSAITDAADTTIQTNADSAVDALVS